MRVTASAPGPTSRYRWVILAVGTLAQGCWAAVFFGIPVLAPVLADRYDLSLPQVGLMLACVDIGGTATLFGWGLLADRIGERVVIAGGLGLAAACLAAAAQAGSFRALAFALVGAGAFGSCVHASTGRAVMAAFAEHERGLALAIRHTAHPVAGAAAALSLPVLTRAGGASLSITVLAGAVAAAALAAGALLRRRPARRAETGRAVSRPARDRRVWQLSVGSSLLVVAQGSILAFFVVFLHEAHGVDTGRAALVLAAVQLTGGALRLAAGPWSDRSGSRIRPLLVIATGLTVALGLTAASAGASLGLVLAPLVVAGSLSLAWNALSYTAAAELGGHERAGAALGIQQTALSLASMTAPILFALTVEAAGWSVAFALAGCSAVAGTAVIAGLRRSVPARGAVASSEASV